MRPGGKEVVLEVIKYDSYFRFSLKDDPNTSWVVRPDPNDRNAFMLAKEVDGRVHGMKVIEYNSLNVGNICKLFLMLITNPDRYFELLTGQKVSVSKVELVNLSKVITGGFTSCVFGLDPGTDG